MSLLKDGGQIDFTTRAYAGLGEMITSINGVANSGGKYWFLYENGATSTKGASETFVNDGDTFEWKYEKSF